MELEEAKLFNLTGVTPEAAVDAFERIWHWKYLELVPAMKAAKVQMAKAKQIPVPSSDEAANLSDWSGQLPVKVSLVFEYFTQLTKRITAQFEGKIVDTESEQKLVAIYARYCVIRGDLERYLERFQGGGTGMFLRAEKLYMEALSISGDEGKAYSGLYIVASARGQSLLSFLFLVKSAIVKNPVRDQLDVVELFVARVLAKPEELHDVPTEARASVGRCLELVAVALGSQGEQSPEEIASEIIKLTPRTDIIKVGDISWDTILVILFISLLEGGSERTSLEKILKIFIGRALTFGNLLALCCSVPFLQRHRWDPVLAAIKKEVISTYTRPFFSAEISNRPMKLIDQLIDFPEGATGSGNGEANVDHIAGSRLCYMLGVPFGTCPSKTSVPPPLDPSLHRKAPVIIDAANVACKAGEADRKAEVEGIVVAYNYWVQRGHPVKIFVSEKHASRTSRKNTSSRARTTLAGIKINLDEIYNLVPSCDIVSIPAQNHDDSYMIQYALQVDGIILSNDMFRDWASQKTDSDLAKEWTLTHVVGYTFVDGINGKVLMPNPDFLLPVPWRAQLLQIT